MTTLLERLKAIVGVGGWSTDPADLDPHLTDWRGIYTGRTLVRLRPRSTAEVSAIVTACAAERVAIARW
jgi:FAD/FMN-containing dehydrogenase